jgi:FlaA1/EpsC-like NDP-sugar epimerase
VPYDLIDESAIPQLARGTRLALYGAGDGAVQFLEWLANNAPGCPVLAVADPDAAKHGRSFHGLPLLPPEALKDIPLDLVVVTCAKGRADAAERLEALGWKAGAGYVLAGKGPDF